MVPDVAAIRKQFPILQTRVPSSAGGSNPLRFFDHAASTHAPLPVLAAVADLHRGGYANVHRGNHHLSRTATDAFEDARRTLLGFVGGVPEHHTLLFSQNTTTALDAAAHAMAHVAGDTVITNLEHHSNDLPHRVRGRVHRVDPEGDVSSIPDKVREVASQHDVKLVAVTGASNVTGERPDVHEIARAAHEHGARILVDAAQLFAHVPIDMKDPAHEDHLDFVAAAGHKSYAPFGSSMLVGPQDVLDAAPPHQPGGGTVVFVGRESVNFTSGPERHEGGTPNVAGAVAFAAAARWLQTLGRQGLLDAEEALAAYGRKRLADVPGLTAYHVGGAPHRLGVFPMSLAGWHHAAVSVALDDRWGVATRDGCFCAHPLLVDLLGLGADEVAQVRRDLVAGNDDKAPGLVRASLGVYNTRQEVDVLADALAELAGTTPQPAYATAVSSGEAS